MSDRTDLTAAGIIALSTIAPLLTSVGIKILAPRLSYARALLLSIKSVAIGFTVYFPILIFSLITLGKLVGAIAGAIASLITLAIIGIAITRQAQKYGIEKDGWLGIGGRAVFITLGISIAIITGITLTLAIFLPGK